MLKNYFTVALRSLRRHKGYSAINIVGLAAGMACCLLILLFVRDELAYDRFHENADRIYRIQSDWGDFSLPATNPPFVARFKTERPDLTVAQFLRTDLLARVGDRAFAEDDVLFANPAVFDVFSFGLVRGDPETALERPYTLLMTESAAEKYFGDADPVGQTVEVDNQFELEVAGVLADVPDNSHVTFDFLISWATLDALYDYSNSLNWGNNSIYTYLLLPEGTTAASVEAQLPDIIDRHAGENWNGAELSLQALTDIHLYSHHNAELRPNSNVAYVYIFSIVAGFVLLIACVNFMNLATARSAERAREVGVRKVVGAQRAQLVQQFLAESIVMALLALVLAAALVAAALPAFRALSGKALDLSVLGDGFTVAAFLGIALVVGVLSGSYPAFVLSGFRPVRVLKGTFRSGRSGVRLRQALVVMQFAISIFLIVGTGVVYSQLDYLRDAALGIDEAQVLMLPFQDQSQRGDYLAFRDAALRIPGVESVTISSEGLPSELLNGNGVGFVGAPRELEFIVPARTVAVGHDFFETLGASVAHGRAFSLDMPTDSTAFILNETAARQLLDTAPGRYASLDALIGETVEMGGRQGPLVGIVEDFNMSSLHEAIEPMVFFFRPSWYDHVLVRAAPGGIAATADAVRDAWAEVYPTWPLDFRFADAAFDAQYRAEERLGLIFSVFAGLAILIACLGLFGLAAFTARQRTKEIGVRKVLGASVAQLVVLLSKDVVRLVAIAVVVTVPLAYLAMSRWLADFAYRVEIGPGVFVAAALLALGIALLTVSYQSIRAALADPVQALRYE